MKKTFVISLFEEKITGDKLEVSQEEKAICGYDYDAIEKLLMDDLKKL